MDPSLFGIVHELAPVLGALVVFAAPVAIFWIKKNHQLRMKELELEAQLSSRVEGRLVALEKRIAGIEAAVGARPERPELMEGPGAPQPLVRQR